LATIKTLHHAGAHLLGIRLPGRRLAVPALPIMGTVLQREGAQAFLPGNGCEAVSSSQQDENNGK